MSSDDVHVTRRLSAVMQADVVGYSRLMERDETGTLEALRTHRDQLIDVAVSAHGGRIVKLMGDGALVEFPSAVQAVDCALAIQRGMSERNTAVPEDRRIVFRIGVNLGDVIIDGDDIHGDGVNVAARLENLAPPGGICISSQVAQQVEGKVDAEFVSAGRHVLKNIVKPVEVWCWPADRAGRLRRTGNRGRRVTGIGLAALAAVLAVGYALLFDNDRSSLPSGPRIAVLPFRDLGGDADEAYFSEGLTKDINAYLSNFTNLFVFAPNAVSGLGPNSGCEAIRRELGADYVLEGTVRRANDKVRVATTLTDAGNCRQLKSPGPYDSRLDIDSVLDIQLEIAQKVAAALGSADAPLFNASVQNAIRDKAPENLDAYQCVLLSYWFYENFAPDRHRRARACLENAVRLDPSYSLAWSRLAFSYNESKKYAIDTPSEWAALSREAANRAIDLDPDNQDAYYALAILTQMTSQSLPEFRQFARKAIELNPNDAFVLADLGTWMGYAGEWETAKAWVSRAMRLNPRHQSWWWQTWHLHALLTGDYAQARDMALRMGLPGNYMVQASLTAAYALNDEQDKAERTLSHLLEIRPDYPRDPRAPFRARGTPDNLVAT
ncbi:MAG: hypothetical protein DWQ08_07785, partial [Proteobacteria bacterium]